MHTIVVNHGGSDDARARRIGRRAIHHSTADRRSGEQQTAPARASRALDVLVVDPRAADLPFVERFLASRGHAVINAANGDAALRLAAQSTFDAVVCDADLALDGGAPSSTCCAASTGCAHARFVLSASIRRRRSTTASPTSRRPYDVEELRRLIEG